MHSWRDAAPAARRLGSLLVVLLALGSASCQATPEAGSGGHAPGADADTEAVQALPLDAIDQLDALLPRLAEHRVVYVGETHDRYDHHLNQLAVIRGLHRLDPELAIGMEFFQQPFQEHLDAYVAGRIDEATLLERTEYFDRWRFDYRLYRPILRYARGHGIPIIALNVPTELTRRVGREGLAALSAEERARLPAEIDRSNTAYEARLRRIFSHHPGAEERSFENFVEVQLLWDEGMAERAARYLDQHPGRRLVVLAGSGHLLYGAGIPSRVERRTGASSVIVLNDGGDLEQVEPAMGDYLLLPRERSLPPAGRLGVFLKTGEGALAVRAFADDSAAAEAGLEEGDQLVRLNGRPVDSYADVRIALADRAPGDTVSVTVARDRLVGPPREREFQVTLR